MGIIIIHFCCLLTQQPHFMVARQLVGQTHFENDASCLALLSVMDTLGYSWILMDTSVGSDCVHLYGLSQLTHACVYELLVCAIKYHQSEQW